MKNKVIVPTGYMSSGSSAITDIFREIKGINVNNAEYEYIFMHCPDGLFDLEDKLLIGNNVLRSDEAIHAFFKCMCELYNKRMYWPGHYYKTISKDFLLFVKKFIHSLDTNCFEDYFWYYQENVYGITWIKLAIIMIFRMLLRKKGQIYPPLKYKKMILSYPTPDLFYSSSKKFLKSIFYSLGSVNDDIVLDQLLLPHNLWRIDNYFDDDLRVIVVDRDPRDIFILNKYYLSKKGGVVPYPSNVDLFCKVYKQQRSIEKKVDDYRILRLHFEDLIYNYEACLDMIYQHIGNKKENHIYKGKYFDPNVSINNTQLFLLKKEYFYESEVIKNKLKDYIYEFPDNNKTIRENEVF